MKRLILTLSLFTFLLLIMVACNSVAEQNNIANTFTDARDFDDAIISYSSAQVNDPDNPVLYLNAARAYFEQGDLEIAVEVLDQAILRGDETLQAQAYYNMGNFYYLSQQPQDAIAAYRESLLLNPENANARHNLELAMLYNSTPTPFDDEMKTNPEEDQVDVSITPTFQPSDQIAPTSTPTPRLVVFAERTPEGGVEGDHFGNQGPITPEPNETPTSEKEEPGHILDPEKASEEIYSEFTSEVSTPTNSDEELKDW